MKRKQAGLGLTLATVLAVGCSGEGLRYKQKTTGARSTSASSDPRLR